MTDTEPIGPSQPTEPITQLAQLKAAIEGERNSREDALVAQEHRIIPAVRNLVSTFTDPGRNAYRASAISALAWCFLPSGAIVVGGAALLVSLLTVGLTFQQVLLLSAQNQQISIQNHLAEAQRRAAQLSELGTILSRIEQERRDVPANSLCATDEARTCYRLALPNQQYPPGFRELQFVEQVAEVQTYVPSRELLGRLAVLTAGLRPYRSLADNSDELECLPSPDQDPSGDPRQSPAGELRKLATELDANRSRTKEELRTVIEKSFNLTSMREYKFPYADIALQWLGKVVAPGQFSQSRLGCSARSPERGQVLLALLAAGVDLESAERAGANFTYANLQGAKLVKNIISGIDLSYAVLRDADMRDTVLINVALRGADLRRAEIHHTVFGNSHLDNSLLRQEFVTDEAFRPPPPPSRDGTLAYRSSARGAYLELTGVGSDDGICQLLNDESKGVGDWSNTWLVEKSMRGKLKTVKALLLDLSLPDSFVKDSANPLWAGTRDGLTIELYAYDRKRCP